MPLWEDKCMLLWGASFQLIPLGVRLPSQKYVLSVLATAVFLTYGATVDYVHHSSLKLDKITVNQICNVVWLLSIVSNYGSPNLCHILIQCSHYFRCLYTCSARLNVDEIGLSLQGLLVR